MSETNWESVYNEYYWWLNVYSMFVIYIYTAALTNVFNKH